MRFALLLVLVCGCDEVPTLVFGETDGGLDGASDEASSDGGSEAATEGGCPDSVPSFAMMCCGNIPCVGAGCCATCASKCMPGDLCCATIGNVVCRKNMTTCP